jgi:hypothetical protein
MADDRQLKKCALFLVHYVPNLVRGESVNIGIFLHSPREKYLGCLFTDDFRRIKRFHPQADLTYLRELQQDFEKQIDDSGDDLDRYIQYMQRTFSNLLQVGEPRTCLLANPQGELADLFARYVGERAAGPPPEDTRLRVKQKLTAALSLAGVWEKLEKRIPVARWTDPGDTFTFDYGYTALQVNGKRNGHTHFIHALSLKRDVDAKVAKVLVYTFDRVRLKENAALTAVVEARAAKSDKVANLSQRILKDGGIQIQPIEGVNDFVQSIRRELMM